MIQSLKLGPTHGYGLYPIMILGSLIWFKVYNPKSKQNGLSGFYCAQPRCAPRPLCDGLRQAKTALGLSKGSSVAQVWVCHVLLGRDVGMPPLKRAR